MITKQIQESTRHELKEVSAKERYWKIVVRNARKAPSGFEAFCAIADGIYGHHYRSRYPTSWQELQTLQDKTVRSMRRIWPHVDEYYIEAWRERVNSTPPAEGLFNGEEPFSCEPAEWRAAPIEDTDPDPLVTVSCDVRRSQYSAFVAHSKAFFLKEDDRT